MEHKRVAVLRGGPSEEYDVSMKTGANVLSALAKIGNPTLDVTISRQGEWIHEGKVKSPAQVLAATDVVFLGLHGQYGEDGEVQKIIQRHNIPFTGSRSLPSAVAFNKHLTKQALKTYDVSMPKHVLVTSEMKNDLGSVLTEIEGLFAPDYIIKPLASGSSVGISKARGLEALAAKLHKALDTYEQILVEEYIDGREATAAVLENFRNEPTYVFPVIEIIPPVNADFFTTEVKYNGATKEICPGNFDYSHRAELSRAAALVHNALGLSQYSRSDFIVKDGKVYFLEVNTLPGLTSESLFPKAAEAVGLEFTELIRFLVETATP